MEQSAAYNIQQTNAKEEAHRLHWMLVTLLCIMPVALSIFFFGTQSLRLDEAQSLFQSSHSVREILNIVAQDVHVPLYQIILHFWEHFLGNTVQIARFLSLLFYVLTIPAAYALGSLIYSRKVGLFAATLMAISPFMNWYGNEIRMYSLFTLVVILNQYAFVSIFKKGSNETRYWLLYCITSMVGVFVHYFFFFNLAVQGLFFLFKRNLFQKGSLWGFVTVAAGVVAVFTPWVLYVYKLGQFAYQTPQLPLPTTIDFFNTLSQFIFGFQSDVVNTFLVSLWPIIIVAAFLTMRRNHRLSAETEYLLAATFVPIAAAFTLSLLVTPVFVSRYLIFTIPTLYILAANIFENYGDTLGRAARMGLTSVMVVTLAIEVFNPQVSVKENYREATTYVGAHAGSGDVFILSAPFTIYPVQYYYKGSATLTTLPQWNRETIGPIPKFSQSTMPQIVQSEVQNKKYAWLLLSYDQGYQKDVKSYFDTHFQRVLAKNFSPGLDLYVYKISYN